MDEGYIKFNCHWIRAEPLAADQLTEINRWRDILYNLGLIGAYANGIGFGNISIRNHGRSFIVSGSATGGLTTLSAGHYAVVNDYNLEQNSITCTGPVKASSESLSHAAIYECMQQANAVIHIHSLSAWERLLLKVPATGEHVSYGTPEMANEIKRLFKETDVMDEKIIVMGGHKEGIITFGKTLAEAGAVLLNNLNIKASRQ